MKPASPNLIALLATGSFVQCDLYTITLAGGGTPIRLTTGDVDIAASIVVSDTGSPDYSGTYVIAGLLLNRPYFARSGGGFIFYDDQGANQWIIGTSLGRAVSVPLFFQASTADWPPFNSSWSTFAGKTGVATTRQVASVFSSKGPFIDSDGSKSGIQKAVLHQKVGLDVDTWQVGIFPRPVDALTGAAYPDTIGGQPWLKAAANGALDGATVQVDRAYWAAWPGTPPPLTPTAMLSAVFLGRMAEVDLCRNFLIINVNSHLELLTQMMMPRNLFQAGCGHNLFDPACTLSAPTYAKTGTVSGVTSSTVFASAITAPTGSGTFTLGRIVFTSGNNVGFSRMVKRWTAGSFTLLVPLPYAIQVGDGFTAYPGCDKQQATCTLFSNLVNFGGQPYIPAPEQSL